MAGRPKLEDHEKKKSVVRTITFQKDVVKLLNDNCQDSAWSKVINRLIRKEYN